MSVSVELMHQGMPSFTVSHEQVKITSVKIHCMGEADVYHAGTNSHYRAILLRRLTPEEVQATDAAAAEEVGG